nr:hypothetical protein [Haloferax larsenii]
MSVGSGLALPLLIPGVFVSLLGAVMLVKPRQSARVLEQLNAIGSKRNLRTVEPADWNVTLTRAVGGVIFLMGVAFLLLVLSRAGGG